ncbi:MAG: NAD-dependent deacylase [Gemmataceae bacterium]|nr:NAD-dependent deacylase [Gemmataceae bacterium]MDW8265252.1 NAD-dependent deacylase [Gemmataceae bacterium]
MHHPVDSGELEAGIRAAVESLRGATTVAVLTGAGISAESGLATFRGAGGLWEGQRVEDVATPFAFRRDPALVWRFYHQRRAALRAARPNPGHYALARLERHFGAPRFTLITQNVDGLHQVAGSERVLEIHGSLRRTRCTRCGQVREQGTEPLPELPHCPACGGLLRPDVVWFHEPLPERVWAEAESATTRCSVFLVVGTSAVVYPAAGLIETARLAGAVVIESNLVPSAAGHLVDIGLYGPAGQVLPRLVTEVWGPA